MSNYRAIICVSSNGSIANIVQRVQT